LVPANSFAEYAPEPNPETKKKDVVWFALNDDRPVFAFGGIWTEFRGDRGTKSKPIPGPHLVYGFLTTAPMVLFARGEVCLQFGEVGPAFTDDHHFPVDDGLAGQIQEWWKTASPSRARCE
jgi:hypothetical protein